MNELKTVIEAKAILAEGPLWHPQQQKLYWVDIEKHELHRFDPEKGEDISLDVGQRVSAVVPLKNDSRMLIALEDGIAKVDMTSGSIKPLVDLEKNMPANRCNDGRCDPAGRFWIGTMNLDEKKEAGNLYRINFDYQVTRILNNVSVSNGMAWSMDHKKMYYIDSPTYLVKAFDYNSETGDISNPHPAITIPKEMGTPDGMTIDEEGMLWVAHYGGAQVCRWNPVNGKLVSKIDIPAPHVTSCTFGGAALNTLFITTARENLSDEEINEYPLSGSVFAIKVGVRGVRSHFFDAER
jgi:sugar lactone lactonase YvrE